MEADDEAVCALWFEDRRGAGTGPVAGPAFWDRVPAAKEAPAVFAQADRWLDAYFAGRDPGPVPPLRLDGTPFCRRVWEVLRTVPYGKTVTYGQIARMLAEGRGGGPVGAQAAGGAVGRNPVLLMVPCHRVVGAKGRLTGYAGGIERKATLLALEQG